LPLSLGMVKGLYGGLNSVLQGTLRLLYSGSPEDVLQLLIDLAHPIGRGCRQRVQERGHNGHILARRGEGGKLPLPMVGFHGLICLGHGLALV
jgi:hypothetical protein